MKYIVAVSGGVDSVALLHMLRYKKNIKTQNYNLEGLTLNENDSLIVAHFDHGIRDTSKYDAHFVRALAKMYSLPFESQRASLGKHASEETARNKRYEFLRTVAAHHHAHIITAHHQDDIVESIAINLQRGTGWRGLAVLGNKNIRRPLVAYTKKQLYHYALQHNLEWVEDETNVSNVYLRNRLRKAIWGRLSYDDQSKLIKLWEIQHDIANQIDAETEQHQTNSRYFMSNVPDAVADELLRAMLQQRRVSLTRPQRVRLISAIKTQLPGTSFEAGNGATVEFTTREFIVKASI